MFAENGVPVWDADAVVHKLYSSDGAAVDPIGKLVPGAVTDMGIDRGVLRARVSEDASLLSKIETIVHPLVAEDRQAFLRRHAAERIVVLDIPLLLEGGGREEVDRILVVSTSESEQRRRVLQRDGMDEETFKRLLSRQMPDAEMRACAVYVIHTDDLETTRESVEALIQKLRGERRQHA